MHEFIRLVKSFFRRHRPARPVPPRIDWPDALDMHTTSNLERVKSEFKETTRQYNAGEISRDQFRAAINLGRVTHVYADEQVMNLERAQKIIIEQAKRMMESNRGSIDPFEIPKPQKIRK